MKRYYKLPLAVALLTSTSVLLAACDTSPFGNSASEEHVLETWNFTPLEKEDRHTVIDNAGFEFYLKRLNTLHTAIQTATDPEAFEASRDKETEKTLAALDLKKSKTFVVNGNTFEVSAQENGFFITRWLKDGQALEIEREPDGLSPKLDEKGNPILATNKASEEETEEVAVEEAVRPTSQPMTADEQFQLGVAFLWLTVEDYINQNPQTDNLTDTKDALQAYFETIQPALQQLKQMDKAPERSDENLATLEKAWDELTRVYHEEVGNLVNGKKPKYSWEGKIVAAFEDAEKEKMVHLHVDYIEGYEKGKALSVAQVKAAMEKMAHASYEIGRDTEKETDTSGAIVTGVSITIGSDGSLILNESNDEEKSKEELEQKKAHQAEASALFDALVQAEFELLVTEKMAVWAPTGHLVSVVTIQDIYPDYTFGDPLTTEQWKRIEEAVKADFDEWDEAEDEAPGWDGAFADDGEISSQPTVESDARHSSSRDTTARDAERAANAKQRELEREAKNKARDNERTQTAAQREAERIQKEAEKEKQAQVKLGYENKVIVEERNFDALYTQENTNKAFDSREKQYLRLRDNVLKEDYLLAVYTTSFEKDGYDAKELGKLRDGAIDLEEALLTFKERAETPERFAASDVAFKAYVANREQNLPGYLQAVLNGNVSAYAQDFDGALTPLGGYNMNGLIDALRRENPSAVSSFGSVYVDGLYQKYFKEMGWL